MAMYGVQCSVQHCVRWLCCVVWLWLPCGVYMVCMQYICVEYVGSICGVYGVVIQTQYLRLMGASVASYSLILQMQSETRLKLERILVFVLVLAIYANNWRYQQDIMSTHRRGRLWMTLQSVKVKRLVVPTQHNRLSLPQNYTLSHYPPHQSLHPDIQPLHAPISLIINNLLTYIYILTIALECDNMVEVKNLHLFILLQ